MENGVAILWKNALQLSGKMSCKKQTLKRSVIKNIGVDIDLKAVESINPFDFFTFMQLDRNGLKEYVMWQNRDDIARLEKESRFGAELLRRTIESWLSSWPLEPESLMGKVDVLKSKIHGVPNYTRFLSLLDDFNDRFMREMVGQSFVPNQKTWEHMLKLKESELAGRV